MRTGEIAREQAQYRRGVVLGLTVAETMLLLLFALLLALGFVLTNRARDLAALNQVLNATRANEQLLQAKVEVLSAIAEKRPTDEFFTELVRARQAQEATARKEAELVEREKVLARDQTLRNALEGAQSAQAETKRLASLGAKLEHEIKKASDAPVKDPFEVLPTAVAAAEAARAAGMTATETRQAFEKTEVVARENATMRGQVARMRNDLAKVGKGGEDPPCWVTPDGKIQYLLDVDLLGSGRLRVRDATPPTRLLDRRALNISANLFGRELTPGEFLQLTRGVFAQGQARQCRHFVYANDQTGSAQKVLFQNLLLTVEGHFYKNLRRSSARS